MTAAGRRPLLGFASLLAMVAAYTVAARLLARPDVLPPSAAVVRAFTELISSGREPPADQHAHHPGHRTHSSDHVATLVRQGVTLQESLAVTIARVLFGLAVGAPLGILFGLLLGWSRAADGYLHPIYVLMRSVPPLALITYVMLWLGHGEAHRLIPIVYAAATTMVIPAYHAVRDVAATYVASARSLGARGGLLLTKVVVPAASPAILGGLRTALAISWMTAIGAEMLMSENGMGNLLVGGGLWSSRSQMRSDPAVIIVGIAAVAVAGWAMDAAAKAATARLTRWTKVRE